MSFERKHLKLLESRIKEKRRFIQVIIGPRQIGKTTMVDQLLKKIKTPHRFVSADGIAAFGREWIWREWENARFELKQFGAKELIFVIDEIQKIDNWSDTVKALWDDDTRHRRPIKVIILGSSRLLIQKGLTESLAGRFETLYLGHWSCDEMQQAFGWSEDKFAWFGGYPGSASLIRDEYRWKQYVLNSLVETSISKDIIMLSRVDKPALMKRLFELGCVYSGQILSFTKVLGQLQDKGNTVTLSHYLQLLDTAVLLAGLEKYSKDRIKQRSSSPKFMVHNTAFVGAMMYERFKDIRSNPAKWGRVVESVVGAHLLSNSLVEGYELYYWRNRNDEIDFVITKGGKTIGLEVKSGSTLRASGLAAFTKQIQPDKTYLIGSTGIQWQDFIKFSPTQLF